MSPPIDIDGSEIQEATIDGQDVSEITIDGQQAADLVVIPDSIVHRWPADEGSGSTLRDAVGSEDLTANFSTWVSGSQFQGGAALDYDGIDDKAEAGSTITALQTDRDFSFEIWVDLQNPQAKDLIANQQVSEGNAVVVGVDISDSSLAGVGVESRGGVQSLITSYNSGLNQFVVTYENSSDTVRGYHNANEITTSGTINFPANTPLDLGHQRDNDTHNVDAIIDLVQVHDKELSDPEVKSLYNSHPST